MTCFAKGPPPAPAHRGMCWGRYVQLRLGPFFEAVFRMKFIEPLLDKLRQLERDVVACERRLAEQEALVVRIKQRKEDTSNAQAELEMMRDDQRRRQQERQRLLSLLRSTGSGEPAKLLS
jgi:hypothetical protein